MNTLRESRSTSLRLPSRLVNPTTETTQVLPVPALPVLPIAVEELRTRFSVFNRTLDLSSIKHKLLQDKGWTLDRANRIEPQYKAFLFLIGSKVKAEFVPTFDIDEMWHAHILDTRKYMADCALHFGEYVHHYPYLGMKDAEDRSRAEGLFSATCATIASVFDIHVHELDATSCGGGGCGGHGCGGHGCGGGHSSCASGHGDSGSHGDPGSGHHDGNGHHNHDDDSSNISSCSSSDEKKRKQPIPAGPSGDADEKPGFWRRIFGLSPLEEKAGWYASVTPELFDEEFRPNANNLPTLSKQVN